MQHSLFRKLFIFHLTKTVRFSVTASANRGYTTKFSSYRQHQKPSSRNHQTSTLRTDWLNDHLRKFEDYEYEREFYRNFQPPEYFNFARDVVDVWANKQKLGEKESSVALWVVNERGDETKLTFHDVSILSQRFANVLKSACGLQREDCILIVLHRVSQWWVINVGAVRSGIITIPGTVLLTVKDIEYRLKASRAKCVITSSEFAQKFDQALENVGGSITKILVDSSVTDAPSDGWLNYDDLMAQADETFQCEDTRSIDPMITYFTSGTTGLPKMTQHTHTSYTLAHLISAKFALNCYDGDIMYNMSDLGWAKAAYSSIYGPWMTGATILQHDVRKFDADVTLQLLADYPITNFCAPPTAYRQFITRDLSAVKFKALKHCTSAGEPVNSEILEMWKAGTGLDIYEFYGQTETTVSCGNHPSIPIRPGSMGKPAPGYDLQGDPTKTASVFVGDFYLTGDRAVMDDEDYVWFVGRSDDVILSAGYRIGPFEIESVLLEHPAVLESAVVSSPDPVRNEVVKAFVILNEAYRTKNRDEMIKELQEHVKTTTAPYKYPRKIEFVDELPKTISGKIRRIELRHREWKGSIR